MPQTNLRHLRVFEAVARLGSFVEASKALHMTSAAASLAIRDLETSLDFRVFDRTTRYVRLTNAGRQYFVQVERVLAEVRAAEECAASLRHGQFETVRIATTPPVISSLLGVVFEHAPTMWPNIKVHAVEVPTYQLSEAVDLQAADITISVRLPNDEHNESQPLFVSRWMALIPRSHRLADQSVLTWREVVKESIVIVNESSRLHIQASLPDDIVMGTIHKVATSISAMAWAASGHGVCIVPGYLRPLAQVHKLRAIPITDPVIEHVLEIGVARKPKPAPHVLTVRDFLLKEVPLAYRHLR